MTSSSAVTSSLTISHHLLTDFTSTMGTDLILFDNDFDFHHRDFNYHNNNFDFCHQPSPGLFRPLSTT
jgi:hypothetical protein